MKKILTLSLLFTYKLFCTEVSSSNLKATGNLCIISDFPIFAGSDKNEVGKNFGIKLAPKDFLVRIFVSSSDLSDWELSPTDNPVIYKFPGFIPLHFFKKSDGSWYKEGDTIILNRVLENNKIAIIKLKCCQKDLNGFFSDQSFVEMLDTIEKRTLSNEAIFFIDDTDLIDSSVDSKKEKSEVHASDKTVMNNNWCVIL